MTLEEKKFESLNDEIMDIVIEAQITEDTTQARKRVDKLIGGLVAELQKNRDWAKKNIPDEPANKAKAWDEGYISAIDEILELLGAKTQEKQP